MLPTECRYQYLPTYLSAIALSGMFFSFLEKFHVIPWLMIEFGFYALWTFFYFAAAVAAAVQVSILLMSDADPRKCFLDADPSLRLGSASRIAS